MSKIQMALLVLAVALWAGILMFGPHHSGAFPYCSNACRWLRTAPAGADRGRAGRRSTLRRVTVMLLSAVAVH
jgi:hypothetical protein